MKDKQQKTWMGTLGSGIYILDANNKELIHLHEDKISVPTTLTKYTKTGKEDYGLQLIKD